MTDKADYPPYGLVTITGSGFTPGEVVVVQIVHLGDGIDDDLTNPAHFPWEVMADATGAIGTSWEVPDSGFEVGATLLLTAYGSTSGRLASTTFTDAAVIRADVSPTYSLQNTTSTFSVLVRNVTGNNSANNLIRHIRLTLPSGFTGVSVASTAFSIGTWTVSAPSLVGGKWVVTASTSDSLGGNPAGWARFNITATTGGARTADNDDSCFLVVAYSDTGGGSNASATAKVGVWVHNTLLPEDRNTITNSGSARQYSASFRDAGGNPFIPAATVNAASDYTLRFTHTSQAIGDKGFKSAVIAVPPQFTINNINSPVTFTDTAGSSWIATKVDNFIRITSGNELKGGAYLNITFNATASSAGSPTWYTAGWLTEDGPSKVPKETAAISGAHPSVTVAQAAPVINWSNPADITYGTLLSGTQLNATVTPNTPGTFVYTPAAGTKLPAGNTQTLSVTFTPTDTNIAPVNKSVLINVIKGTVTVTADAQTKVYGALDPALTYQVTSGALVAGDTFSGALTRVAGTNVGSYAIQQGTLTAGTNYTLTYVGANLTITKRDITGSFTAASKVYDGNAIAMVLTRALNGVVGSDAVTLDGGTAAFADANVGNGKTVTLSGATLGGTAAGNYNLTSVATTTADITPRPVTITADAKSKIYGNTDPAFTYQVTSGSLAPGDSFSGALTRVAGENVGTYAIQKGTVALSTNYELTYVGANLTITKRDITGSFTAASKVYDGNTTAAVLSRSLNNVVGSDAVTLDGGTAAFADANVGNGKTVTLSGATLGGTAAGNYNLTSVSTTTADITPRPVTITADTKSKIYGNADPAFSYQVTSGSLAPGDSFSGALTRVTGENVGTYAVQQGTVALSTNYALTYVGADLTITTRPITITADGKTKVYGNADPVLTYQITSGSLAFSDLFSGALVRVTGENVGTYAIQQGTVALSTNYALTYVGAELTITKREITGSFTAANKVYDGNTAATVLSRSLNNVVGSDPVTLDGGTAAFADANVGTGKTVTLSGATLAGTAAGNYNLTSVATTTADITQRPVTITADAKSKIYGNTDPAFTYQVTSGSLAPEDSFSGALTRVAVENVGTYAIQQGTVALSTNYALTYVGANLTITTRPITITADGKTKVYGNADPTLTYQITSGSLAFTDAFSGALVRVAGENVGSYAIQQGTVSLSTNYELTYVGANLTITKRDITGSFTAASKVYDGNAIAMVLTRALNGVLGSDAVTLDGGTAAFADANVGTAKTVTLSGATLGGTAAGNYNLTSVATMTADITPRPVTITADAKSKIYGNADPAFSYQVTSGSLAPGDSFSGALTRVTGENVGTYAVQQGTVALSTNYALTYVGANLTIAVRPITITADGKTKIYGNADPALTYQITSGNLVFGDSFSGALTRAAGENVGIYAIQQGAAALSTNYALTYVGANLTITKRDITVTITSPAAGALFAAGNLISFEATVIGLVGSDNITFTWTFDGLNPTSGASTGSSIVKTKTLGAGVYQVALTVNPGGANANYTIASTNKIGSDDAFVVVYDPSGGFVTGGGWIMSPTGAYRPDLALTGKASFGFVSKYHKGANIPTGETEFKFSVASMNFKSTSYEWLVVAGAKAQYKGVGKINGAGNYGFMLTATDSGINGGGNIDKFRIKIWDKDNDDWIVYDNAPGSDDLDVSPGTVLMAPDGNGSIVIHK